MVERLANHLIGPDGKPHLFVSPKCERFIWEMNHWRKKKGTNEPSRDNCDAIKAVAYWLADRYSFQLDREDVTVSSFSFGEERIPGLEDLGLTEAERDLLEADLAGRIF